MNTPIFVPEAVALFLGLLLIGFYWSSKEDKRRREEIDKYPRARKITMPKKVDESLDETERAIS
jgi:hypothetical protein